MIFEFWLYFSGLLLREREEELGFLYERINRQEVLCRNGDIKMQVMDEKISFLKLKVAEKKREIKLCFKELAVKNALDAQLMRLQIQVGVKGSLFLLSFCILKFKLISWGKKSLLCTSFIKTVSLVMHLSSKTLIHVFNFTYVRFCADV